MTEEEMQSNQTTLSGGNLGGTIVDNTGWELGTIKNFFDPEDEVELQYRRDTDFQAVFVGKA